MSENVATEGISKVPDRDKEQGKAGGDITKDVAPSHEAQTHALTENDFDKGQADKIPVNPVTEEVKEPKKLEDMPENEPKEERKEELEDEGQGSDENHVFDFPSHDKKSREKGKALPSDQISVDEAIGKPKLFPDRLFKDLPKLKGSSETPCSNRPDAAGVVEERSTLPGASNPFGGMSLFQTSRSVPFFPNATGGAERKPVSLGNMRPFFGDNTLGSLSSLSASERTVSHSPGLPEMLKSSQGSKPQTMKTLGTAENETKNAFQFANYHNSRDELGDGRSQLPLQSSTPPNKKSAKSKPLYPIVPQPIVHANSIATLESRLHAEFDIKLARLEARLERKIADNGREDAKAVVLEHKLKASEEANEEYKKQILELREKVMQLELEEMRTLRTKE